jgi:hypothetical protein
MSKGISREAGKSRRKRNHWHLRATEEEGDTREIKEPGMKGGGGEDRRKTNLFFG